ncbi:hypothetical protein ACFJIV_08145 [Mucilaginibacter sp. UC70_90]
MSATVEINVQELEGKQSRKINIDDPNQVTKRQENEEEQEALQGRFTFAFKSRRHIEAKQKIYRKGYEITKQHRHQRFRAQLILVYQIQYGYEHSRDYKTGCDPKLDPDGIILKF